ncbi:hypothetical protein [Crocosphaera sp. Alani8]|uniref:hypothetical protein n=1 Tax=Crocosphaera sp. Alani8 TaxID=3038952 RepID=UPI00313D0FE6
MTSSDKSHAQDNQNKPTLVALIKKNKPETSPESQPKAEEITPPKTSSQSRAKKKTSSTTKSKQTTKLTDSKKAENTTTKTAQKKPQSTTPKKTKNQSQSTSAPKEPRKPTAKTPKTTNSQSKETTSQKAKTNPPSKTTPKKSSNSSPKNQNSSPKKPKQPTQKKPAKTESKTQNQPPTSQPKKPKIDPIQKALLYKNEKKQRLGISDYQDQINARDISLSLTGIISVAAGSLLQTFLAGSIMGLFPLTALAWLSAAFAKNTFTFHRTALDIKREEDAEKKIAQLLKDTYLNDGGEIYSLLDENTLIIPDPEGYRQDYLDIGLTLPNGQFLAISVKALKGEKDFVYIDQKTNKLRYRNSHGLKRWNVNPIDELRRQIDWLWENTRILNTSPLGIVIIMAPAKLKTFDDVAYQIGDIKILELDNILIVREEDLLTLINEVLSRRKV